MCIGDNQVMVELVNDTLGKLLRHKQIDATSDITTRG